MDNKSQRTLALKKKIHQICPYCLRKFSKIFKHKCKIAPEGFRFKKRICNDKFFLTLYEKFSVFDNKRKVLDVYKLNQNIYLTTFVKIYHRLYKDQELEVEFAFNDNNFDDNEEIKDHLSKLRKPEPKKSTKYYYSKIQKICPFCFQRFTRLDYHKCKKAPADINFKIFQGDDSFYKKYYQEVGAWDERGFLNTYGMDKDEYKRLFLEIFEQLKKMDSPSIEDLKIDNIFKGSRLQDNKIVEKDKEEKPMDLLEMLALEMDFDPKIDETYGSTSKTSLTLSETSNIHDSSSFLEEDQMPLCFSCKNMISCPRGIDSTQMESIFACKFYIDFSSKESEVSIEGVNKDEIMMQLEETGETGESEKNGKNDLLTSIIARKEIDRIKKEQETTKAEKEKQNRIADIMARWQDDRGELKIFCKKCEVEMSKIVTRKKTFYRCSNYPECKIIAEKWYIDKCLNKKVFSQKIRGDLILLYQYDDTKNTIYISEIYSESKLFL